jgi:molybdopterin molybdotransferase
MNPPLPLDEAQARLLAIAAPLGARAVPTERARPLPRAKCRAARTQPAADLSAMDGYAVAGDGPWRIIGESAAGRPFAGRIAPGEALRISTGALMPAGGEAVLLQEEAAREGERLSVMPGGAPAARHIRRRGFDFTEGELVLSPGCASPRPSWPWRSLRGMALHSKSAACRGWR